MYVVFESEREITIFYGKYAILKAIFRNFAKTLFIYQVLVHLKN